VELDGAHGDVELRSDLFIGLIADHGVENFLLARAQTGRAHDRAALFEEFFRAGLQSTRETSFRRDENLEIVRIGAADKALHGQQAGHSLYRAIEIGGGFGAKLG